MRIAYFQMDKHSSIALHDLHIFPTKNQIIVTLLFGPISYSWIWQTFFFVIPSTTSNFWWTDESQTCHVFHRFSRRDPRGPYIQRSGGTWPWRQPAPKSVKNRLSWAYIFCFASGRRKKTKTNPPEGWEIWQTSSGRMGWIFVVYYF